MTKRTLCDALHYSSCHDVSSARVPGNGEDAIAPIGELGGPLETATEGNEEVRDLNEANSDKVTDLDRMKARGTRERRNWMTRCLDSVVLKKMRSPCKIESHSRHRESPR